MLSFEIPTIALVFEELLAGQREKDAAGGVHGL